MGVAKRSGAQRDVSAQSVDSCQLNGVADNLLSPPEKIRGLRRATGEPRRLAGGRQARALHRIVDRQLSASGERGRGNTVRTAGFRALRDNGQIRCHGVVRSDTRLTEMPRPALRHGRWKRRSDGTVNPTAGVGIGLGIDRRPNQRVAKLGASGSDFEQPCFFSRREQPDIGAHRLRRPSGHRQLAVGDRRDQQSCARRPGQSGDPAPEHARHRLGDRQRQFRSRPVELFGVTGEFDEGQRVARGDFVELGSHPCRRGLSDQFGCCGLIKAAYLPRRKAWVGECHVALRAHADHQGDRIGQQPPRHEIQGLGRWRIEQVRVVDEYEQRSLFGVAAQQAQCRCCYSEPFRRRAVTQHQRDGQRFRLWPGNVVDEVQSRTQKLVQTGEAECRLPFATGGA